ncbi:MAG: alpha-amylase family glycosyl hydrolase [Verrucomicrobiota bacterium]
MTTLLRALVLVVLLPLAALAEAFIGWIPLQQATAGESLELDLKRFYEPDAGFRLEFPAKGDCYSATLDETKLNLSVKLEKNAKGIVEIPLRVVSKSDGKPATEAVLAIAAQPRDGASFRFDAGQKRPARVTVAGSFNSWNSDALPLAETSPGIFELYVPLPQGTQEYKFVVDGVWTLDLENPKKNADGTNSIVEGPDRSAADHPSVFVESSTDSAVSFRLVPGPAEIIQLSAVLQKPDGTSASIPATRDGNTVVIDTTSAPANSWVRLVASDATGLATTAARAIVRPDGQFQWQDGILYYAFTDRFVDGDKSNNRRVEDDRVLPQANYYCGDFAGVRQRIEEGYFEKLGVNILWLAPLNTNPPGAWQEYLPPYRFYTGYHGYWPIEAEGVEARFGGAEELEKLVSAAHAKDTKIIADLVLKHVHVENPLWKEKREWFGTVDLPDGTKNLRRWNDHQFTTWFEEWLPGFDFSNPESVAFLLDNAEHWISTYKLDGYRLDAVKHIEFSFWPAFRTSMRNLEARESRPPGSRYYVGETFMDRQGIMSFVGPNMLDGQFDFPLYDTIMDVLARRSHGFQELEKSLHASETIYGKETLMSPLVGNHDKSRFMAFADGDMPDPVITDEEELGWTKPPQVDNPESYEYLKLATAFILAIDGVPMIYYGDEVGLTGAGDPDNRRMMPLESELNDAQKSVRTHFEKVAKLRRAHPALRYGNRRPLVAEGDRYAFIRRHLDDTVLCVWNRGKAEATFEVGVAPEMPDGTYRDALSDRTIEVKNGKTNFQIPALSSAFFVKAAP